MVERGGDPGVPLVGGAECPPAPSGPGLALNKYQLNE